MITPYTAARNGIGADKTAHVVRLRTDGTRSGLATGRHAAWNWTYEVEIDGQRVTQMAERSLVEARCVASTMAARVVESWDGGATFVRGPKGAIHRAAATPEDESRR